MFNSNALCLRFGSQMSYQALKKLGREMLESTYLSGTKGSICMMVWIHLSFYFNSPISNIACKIAIVIYFCYFVVILANFTLFMGIALSLCVVGTYKLMGKFH